VGSRSVVSVSVDGRMGERKERGEGIQVYLENDLFSGAYSQLTSSGSCMKLTILVCNGS
jgi:hypothetical protein